MPDLSPYSANREIAFLSLFCNLVCATAAAMHYYLLIQLGRSPTPHAPLGGDVIKKASENELGRSEGFSQGDWDRLCDLAPSLSFEPQNLRMVDVGGLSKQHNARTAPHPLPIPPSCEYRCRIFPLSGSENKVAIIGRGWRGREGGTHAGGREGSSAEKKIKGRPTSHAFIQFLLMSRFSFLFILLAAYLSRN